MLGSLLALVTAAVGTVLVRDLRSARAVPLLQPAVLRKDTPAVSVIVPARDEAGRIGRLLEGLAAQTTHACEVVILDDNSTDGTAAVVRSFEAGIPGLKVVRGAPLAAGWSGKCWACWQAAQQATAPWLLFLDADTAPAPALVATLMQYAVAEQIDLLTLLPLLELESFWERVLMPPFVGLIQAAFPLDRVNDPDSPIALANGQCILVRRDVYFACGGHGAVRGSVLEDVELATVIKHAGYRLQAVGGPDLMRVRMYTSLGEVVEGLQKNAWAGYAAGGWRSGVAGARQALLALLPLSLLIGGLIGKRYDRRGTLVARWGAIQWLLTNGYWAFVVRRLNRLNPLWALLYPFGTLCYFILAGWAWVMLRFGRGVVWKGRAYGPPRAADDSERNG